MSTTSTDPENTLEHPDASHHCRPPTVHEHNSPALEDVAAQALITRYSGGVQAKPDHWQINDWTLQPHAAAARLAWLNTTIDTEAEELA